MPTCAEHISCGQASIFERLQDRVMERQARGWVAGCNAAQGSVVGGTRLDQIVGSSHGFRQVTPAEKDRLLRTYWSIPERQVERSVVLANAVWLGALWTHVNCAIHTAEL
jgi:hypothetical protein